MIRPEIATVPTVAPAAAELVAGEMRRAVERRGRFALNLSGGSTPLEMFRLLAARPELPWGRCWVVWGDERFVAPDHRDSNQGAARAALLDHVPIPAGQILAWPIDSRGPAAAAERYAASLATVFPTLPRFDLTLLGLGEDAHTASLFPGTGAVRERGLATVIRPPGGGPPRLSLTAATLSSSRTVAFLVRGEAKRAAFETTLAGSGQHDRYPARAITAVERLLWLSDLAPGEGG